MMGAGVQTYSGEAFDKCSTYDLEAGGYQKGLRFGPARYESCFWQSVDLVALHDWEFDDRPILTGIEMDRCRCDGDAYLSGAVLDDCTVNGWASKARLVDCALRQCVFRGRFRSLWFEWSSGDRDAHRRAQTVAFHRSADWAIDVSEAESAELEVRSIPPDKTRVDPTRQFFASGLSVQAGAAALSEIPLGDYGLTGFAVRGWLATRHPEYVKFFSLSPRSKTKDAELELIALLHEFGLVLPTAPH
jgi:hypothetical protein